MKNVDVDSPALHNYLSTLQAIINRMAANSAACKTWCVGLVSAIILIIASEEKPDYIWLSLVPVGLFLFLDSYYLGLEKEFRSSYNMFIKKVHSGTATLNDLFIITPKAGKCARIRSTTTAFGSTSVWPFYILIGLMLVIVRWCM